MKLAVRAHDFLVKGTGGLAEACRECAVGAVQLVPYKSYDGIAHAPGAMNGEKARTIGRELRESGIDVALIGAYFNPVHHDPAVVADGMAIFSDYIACAGKIGCAFVGTETGSRSDSPWVYHPENSTEAAFSQSVACIRALDKNAREHGVHVCIEGAAGHVMSDVRRLNRAYDAIESDDVRIIFDLYNFLNKANCRDYYDILCEGLETFGERIHCFHIKDAVFDENGARQVPLGRGEMDYAKLVRAIKKYDENATLVLEGTTGGDIRFGVDYIWKKWRECGI